MYSDEFKEYVENNGRAYEKFIIKATDYLNEKNSRRQPNKRWKESRIDKEAEKMWTDLIKNTYDKIKSVIKTKRRFSHEQEIEDWIEFLRENEILESFSDSIDEIEFE
jgi:hypothetical protein